MNDPHDEPLPGLEALYADRKPDPSLEERIAADYRRAMAGRNDSVAGSSGESRLNASRARIRFRAAVGRPARVAAGAVLFLAGFGVARLLPDARPAAVPIDPDPVAVVPGPGSTEPRRFMLLLWERPAFAADVAPGRLAAEYSDWARATAASGVAISGHELGIERALLRPGDAAPPPPQGARLGGYFLIEVRDAAQARRLAEGHPHLGYGGWIEVAEVL